MENQPMVAEKKNNWKIAGVILVIVSVILAIVTGLFICRSTDQRSQIDELNNKIEQLVASKDNENNETGSNENGTNLSEDDLRNELQKMLNYNETIMHIGSGLNNSRYADVAGYNVMELWYRSNGGQWTHFKDYQQLLPCDLYNTQEIREAFAATVCYDKIGAANLNEINAVGAYFKL